MYDDKYAGNDNYGRLRQDYILSLTTMTPEELFNETKDKMWLSAYANNNPKSDYHWQHEGCYDEWVRRGNREEYGRAFKEVYKQEFG